MKHNIAVVGASGLVGRKILQLLDEFDIEINNLYLYSSAKSAGKIIKFKGNGYVLLELKQENLVSKKIDFALFSAGNSVSKEFAPMLAQSGAIVIDNSSYFRMQSDVPLIVPEVNPEAINTHKNIISNPNCSTIQAMVVLAPLHKRYKIKKLVFSTYQAVSGAGQKGCADLKNGIAGKENKFFPHPIFNNILPHIDIFYDDGYTKEEYKMINETRKILNDESIKITATAVRVPVFNCHSESVNVEFEKPCDINEIKQILTNSENVIVLDDFLNCSYPTPLQATGKNEVFVGRIRKDFSVESGANLWIVADNIRKGAATNAVQILKLLINKN
ncbi:MAG: aspartate-semialdehyde dehydrogenase [Clostridia bacterium]|nr:aspartate-semialdehyde dehydrogenase [Clostridia bacterium]